MLRPTLASCNQSNQVVAWEFDNVFVLQSDIVGFTSLGSRVTPLQLCTFLHDLFSRFDDLAIQLGVHKIETVGCAQSGRAEVGRYGCAPPTT